MYRITSHQESARIVAEGWTFFGEDGTPMSSAGVGTVRSMYGRDYITTNTIGGVGTPPQYRRNGCVRQLINAVFEAAPERGWAVSLLHPFSFSYYRQFGYEKVADHRILEFPMSAISYVPRYADLVPFDETRLPAALAAFRAWAVGRNVTFERVDGHEFQPSYYKPGCETYVLPDGTGYVTLRVENHLEVNHMVSDFLHVYELVYVDPESLMKLFGFLRMFEGQLDRIKIHNCAMMPEIDAVLRHYTHTSYRLVPDIMARVLDLPAMLANHVWPEAPGAFVLDVRDTLPNVGGVWSVEYAGGACEARRAEKSPDVVLTAPALAPILYGYEQYTPQLLQYAPGVEVTGNPADFVRAFPKQNCGLFEHF